ncbi:hypothetical protein V1477_020639 [Vespula maculifrons]|uniref:Uncharacterized protein n=1 Tax=Vespula maculifrons TaxID=7453 RepID=A0ABD2AMI8_VESMC
MRHSMLLLNALRITKRFYLISLMSSTLQIISITALIVFTGGLVTSGYANHTDDSESRDNEEPQNLGIS